MPDFSRQTYWTKRFTTDPKPFDWLLSASDFAQIIRDMLQPEDVEVIRKKQDYFDLLNAQILHIGCGTSDVSALKDLVRDAAQVHNVDFAERAVEIGRGREMGGGVGGEEGVLIGEEREKQEGEKSIEAQAWASNDDDEREEGEKNNIDSKLQDVHLQPEKEEAPSTAQRMRWTAVDLLALESITPLLQSPQPYDLILDKSTSDSIACGPDLSTPLPYALNLNGWTRDLPPHTSLLIHPLHLLAIHLAALTTPGTGRWICLSYSEDRFPLPETDEVCVKAGFPRWEQLWVLERKERVEKEESLKERRERLKGGVHRPLVGYYVYVLRRTAVIVA